MSTKRKPKFSSGQVVAHIVSEGEYMRILNVGKLSARVFGYICSGITFTVGASILADDSRCAKWQELTASTEVGLRGFSPMRV